MPQNTPMKRQFTTIDGRTVMSNLPQHWKGDDWAITGVDNPLPVGNYVQTEAGVGIPQKGSDDGAADVRLTGSNVEIIADVSNIEVPTGVTGLAIQHLDISKYKYFFVQFAPGGADKYTIQMRPNRGDETIAFTSINLYKNESGSANRILEKVEVNCLSASFYIINEMDNDHTFGRMIVLGVRR